MSPSVPITMINTLVILVVLLTTSCSSVPLPSTFKKCNRKQADFNQCLTTAVQDAIHQLDKPHPEVNLPSFEPFVYPVGTVRLGAGPSVVHFRQIAKNVRVHKLTEFSSLNASMDFNTNIFRMNIDYPILKFEYDYEIDGKILVMPIRGKGLAHIHPKNLSMEITFTLEEKNKHYKVVNSTITYTKMGGLMINHENLFDGNKELGDKVNAALNENWKSIFDDLKAGYEKINAEIFGNVFDKFLDKVSASELFGDP
ncbi:circadian clock-controlled protein daywake-like [Zophobas morio]|uniref:circadian clock-controlled protein daywake-like n=1 Tax=Zophobas morio TaxID=2755281 RepID=UPI00308287A9